MGDVVSLAKRNVYKTIPQTELRGSEFFGIEIGGYRLVAKLSADGPYIKGRRSRSPSFMDDGVALGSCTCLIFLDAHDVGRIHAGSGKVTEGLWICKYGPNEPRISLNDLTRDQAEIVSTLFGIPWNVEYHSNGSEFYDSPAWPALVQYVKKHPRISARYSEMNSYVGNWLGNAKAEMLRGPQLGA